MIVCQGFLHFSYGIRESHNLINITKITSIICLRWKKKFWWIKTQRIAEREREEGIKMNIILIIMQRNAWTTIITKH